MLCRTRYTCDAIVAPLRRCTHSAVCVRLVFDVSFGAALAHSSARAAPACGRNSTNVSTSSWDAALNTTWLYFRDALVRCGAPLTISFIFAQHLHGGHRATCAPFINKVCARSRMRAYYRKHSPLEHFRARRIIACADGARELAAPCSCDSHRSCLVIATAARAAIKRHNVVALISSSFSSRRLGVLSRGILFKRFLRKRAVSSLAANQERRYINR